jgi:hypothetical protein
MRLEQVRDSRLALLIFLTVFAVHFASGNKMAFDSALYLHTSMSIVRQGNTNLDEYQDIVSKQWWWPDKIDGHIYGIAPLGPALLGVPFVFATDKLSGLLGLGDFNQYLEQNIPENLQSFIACLIVALTTVLLYQIARLYLDKRRSLLVVFVFAFCTSAWSVASRTLWQHGPSMLMLTLVLYLFLLARRRPHLIQFAALPLAFSYVIRPTNSIPVGVFSVLVLIEYRRYFWRYLFWAMTIALPFEWYSLSIYHTFLPSYYQAYSGLYGATFFQALAGHLISPSRGLFIFSPVLAFSIYGIALKLKQKQWRRLDTALLGIVVLHWIVISLWWNWWGGASFGPRIFSDMVPFLVYFLIPVAAALPDLRGWRKAAVATTGLMAIAISIFVNYRGANDASLSVEWNAQPAPIDLYPSRVWDWRDIEFLRGITWGDPVDLAVSGKPAYQFLDPDLYSRLGTNAVRAREFDATTALIAPAGPAWFAIVDGQSIGKEFASLFDGVDPETGLHTIVDDQAYRLYHFDLGARLLALAQQSEQTAVWSSQLYPGPTETHALTLPVEFGRTAKLLGYVMKPGSKLSVTTYWQAGDQVVTPLQMFVHAIGPDGSIVAQQDQLAASADDWRAGDVIAQQNRLALPAQSGPVWIEIGLYNFDTGERLPVLIDGHEVDQRVLLQQLNSK